MKNIATMTICNLINWKKIKLKGRNIKKEKNPTFKAKVEYEKKYHVGQYVCS